MKKIILSTLVAALISGCTSTGSSTSSSTNTTTSTASTAVAALSALSGNSSTSTTTTASVATTALSALSNMDFSSMSCDQITSAFASYDEKAATVNTLTTTGAALGLNTSSVSTAADSTATSVAALKQKANLVLVLKGCTVMSN